MLRAPCLAALACCALLIAAHAPLSSVGIGVNLSGAPITISSVWSTAAFDYDFVSGGAGPTYFDDCLYYAVRSKRRIERVEFLFALSVAGSLRGPTLPVTVVYEAGGDRNGGDKPSACRRHGYGDGARGGRLIAWVNAVYYADGTAWHAPTGDRLKPIVTQTLDRQGE